MLTNNNYFSQAANVEYFSVSQFKAFMKCEHRAYAELTGDYEPEQTTPLLVGSYVDAYFEGALDKFKAEHPEILKRDGALKADYKKADEIIERCNRDKLFSEYMSGKPQVIMTGELFGYKWKIKVDSLHPDKIVDLKVMRDFEPVYVPGEGKQHFINAWGYDIQAAIYQAIVEQNTGKKLPFYIAAASKEKNPDIQIFKIPQHAIDTALKIVEYNIDRIADIKSGLEEPARCGKCDYCKATKVLTEDNIIDYTKEIF